MYKRSIVANTCQPLAYLFPSPPTLPNPTPPDGSEVREISRSFHIRPPCFSFFLPSAAMPPLFFFCFYGGSILSRKLISYIGRRRRKSGTDPAVTSDRRQLLMASSFLIRYSSAPQQQPLFLFKSIDNLSTHNFSFINSLTQRTCRPPSSVPP